MVFDCVFRELQTHGTVVWWMDNFSKCYAVAMQSIASGAFAACNWTGFGFRVYPSLELKIAQAMPDTIFQEGVVSGVVQRIEKEFTAKWKQFDCSLVQQFRVRNVPLKPSLKRVPDALRQVLMESRDGLKTFHPHEISPHNVGSNRGLLLILKQMSEERQLSDRRIRIVCCDCNIFNRIIKVIDEVR